MISKLIVHAEDRNSAIRALYSALNDYKVVGLPTNIKFLKRVLLNKSFRDWDYDTSFIALNEEELIGVKDHSKSSDSLKAQVAIANVWLSHQKNLTQKDLTIDPWTQTDNFRLNTVAMRKVKVQEGADEDASSSVVYVQYHSGNKFSVFTVDQVADTKEALIENAEILVNPENNDELIIRTDNEQIKLPFLVNPDGVFNFFDLEGQPLAYSVPTDEGESGEVGASKADFVKSPMPGTIVKHYCQVGQRVLAGEPLISLESMKMEFMVKATHDVTIKEIRVNEGEFVQMGERMVIFEQEEE